jgi:hypothetical protein
MRSVPLCVSVLAMAVCWGALAAEPPDLTGVWGPYVEPGKPSIRQLRAEMTLPFTPDAKRKVDEYRALTAPTGDNPGAFCLGYGMPESMIFSGGYPMEIIQRPEQITVIYEAHSETRRLYFPVKVIAEGDRVPDRDGYSVAHWDGDTLVVETTSLKEQVDQLYPHSDAARIVERYQLTHDSRDNKVLVNDWTLTDPAFYTKLVSGQKKWTLEAKGILLPYECNEEAWLDHLQALKEGKAKSSKY